MVSGNKGVTVRGTSLDTCLSCGSSRFHQKEQGTLGDEHTVGAALIACVSEGKLMQ